MEASLGRPVAAPLEHRRARLSSPDASLATELVYGVLRRRAQLDWLILQASARDRLPQDNEVTTALRLGAYQLRFLDRIPPHAAVSESVELVRRFRKRSAAGLVNAVLRKLPSLPESWPDDATRLSLPAWLLDRWTHHWGQAAAEAAAAAALETPPVYVRVPSSFGQLENAEPTELSQCYRITGKPAAGTRIQDIGSQWAGSLLAVQPGQTILDLCAAPGNKTAQALESGPAMAVACDTNPSRLRAMAESSWVRGARLVRLDASLPLPFGSIFDRILVDAPCSGTGTLARNPDIKWRLAPADIARLAARQKSILRNALLCLKPGGRLVYSICSIEPEEYDEVLAEAACGRHISRFVRLPGRDPGDGFQAAVIT